ncbi:hypothetical protein B9Z55_014884 [Caenorhabditis nigoni]|uniref:Shugoshin C-terminal domain-containing protein n=1 Tax=Caenorhabditis nigoni TaxID=1611254 RepID=A0A2G5U7S0_9PELO|nr:hypothetical protein B9Z55_014884 [Caenorhabditis nigoni]
MNAKAAQSLFGAIAPSKKAPTREEPAVNFKSTNESLIKKNLQLKQQLSQCTKALEKLRNENIALREKNQELVDATLEEKIERIVEQRVKSRLAHAAVLHKKLVQNIQQTGLELGGIFKDLEPEPSGMITRRAPKMECNLEKLDESPMRNFPRSEYEEENKSPMNTQNGPSSSSSMTQNLENGTPRMTQRASKGRRSELFTSLHENVPEEETGEAAPAVGYKRAPLLIAPSETPGGPPKKAPPRKAPTPRFKKPSTPAPAPISEDSEMPSTVRRQRSAKMNIKSMKEPSVNSKLRRPGKHDEPMPFIDTFF